jgi:hypothetical protein
MQQLLSPRRGRRGERSIALLLLIQWTLDFRTNYHYTNAKNKFISVLRMVGLWLAAFVNVETQVTQFFISLLFILVPASHCLRDQF